jgi:heme exporter protein C
MNWLVKLLVVLVAGLGIVDLYLALIWSPPEAQMGDLVRIMYFHVASAWTAMLAFSVAFVTAVLYVIFRQIKWDVISVSSVEIGLVYTSITLVTGMLWAKPIWNTWWTWDPRLTTTLILWFLFIGYTLLRGTVSGLERRALVSSIYAIVAFADVPVIHLSVRLWRSIHPDLINDTGFQMPSSMAYTLMFGFVVFLLVYALLLYMRAKTEFLRLRLFQLRQATSAFSNNERGGM